MINCIWITLITVIVIDQTDVVSHLKRLISRILTKGKSNNDNYELKPIDCSLCTSFWLNLIYLFIAGLIGFFPIVFILALAILTPVINEIITLIINILHKLINEIADKINL